MILIVAEPPSATSLSLSLSRYVLLFLINLHRSIISVLVYMNMITVQRSGGSTDISIN